MVNSIDLFHARDTDMLSKTGIDFTKIFVMDSCCEKLFKRIENVSRKINIEKGIGRNMNMR